MTDVITGWAIRGIVAAGPQEYEAVVAELPEVELLQDEADRQRVATVWASFLRESSYSRIGDCPPFPPVKCDLAGHTRHVVKNCLALAGTLDEFWGIHLNREVLIAAALTHDASKLVEQEGPDAKPTVHGSALLHAQATGVRCPEVGLHPDLAYIVSYHPYTPPHVHVKPRCAEFVVLSWADLGAADLVFWLEGIPTHLDIDRRFFQLA